VSPTIPPGLVGCIYSLSLRTDLHAPGCTSSILSMPVYPAAPSGVGVTARVALEGKLPWVRHIPDIPEREGVTDGRSSLRRVARFLRVRTDERLDNRRVTLWDIPMVTVMRAEWCREYPPTVKRE